MCIEYIKNVKFEVSSAVFLRNSWSTACYATVWVCVREDIGEGRGFIHQAGKQIHPYDAHHARKKTHAKCALLSGVLKPSVKSYTMLTVPVIFSNMFLIPVNAPAHACAAHLSYFSQLFFYSSFNSFFSGVSLFELHIQTGDACFLLHICDTPLNPCYFSVDCEPRWSFASSERSFYGCQTREFLAHAGLQSHRSVILHMPQPMPELRFHHPFFKAF